MLFGQTPGMRLLGLRLAHPRPGSRLAPWRAVVRTRPARPAHPGPAGRRRRPRPARPAHRHRRRPREVIIRREHPASIMPAVLTPCTTAALSRPSSDRGPAHRRAPRGRRIPPRTSRWSPSTAASVGARDRDPRLDRAARRPRCSGSARSACAPTTSGLGVGTALVHALIAVAEAAGSGGSRCSAPRPTTGGSASRAVARTRHRSRRTPSWGEHFQARLLSGAPVPRHLPLRHPLQRK